MVNSSEIQKQNKDNLNILHGLYFDGRKDETLVNKKVKSKLFRITIKE